jgi:hypothetical protein
MLLVVLVVGTAAVAQVAAAPSLSAAHSICQASNN